MGLLAVYLGQHYIFEDGTVRQEVEGLEDEADAPAAQSGALFIAEGRRVCAVKQVAAAGGAVEAADDIEQRRFARAGGAGDGQPLAWLQAQVDIYEGVNGRLAAKLPAHLI
jgi:hypothetical protein